MGRAAAAALCLALALAVLPAAVARADVNDFTVTYFGADYTLAKTDPQGEMRVVERIKVHFNDQNHGLLRAIPSYYRKHRLQLHINSVQSPSGAPASFSTSGSNGNVVVKIGDAHKTVTGNQEYVIDYTVRNVIGFYADHDELYWNINGNSWQQPFQAVTATVHMPDDIRLVAQNPECFTGSYGSTQTDCSITYDKTDQALTTVSLRPMDAGETLSFVAGFEKGYFRPATWHDTLGEYAKTLQQVFVPLVLIGGAGSAYWFKRGRDAKGRGVIVPEYDAPPGLMPIEAGTIMDFKTENRDITATIIDLAIRGYIKIIEQKTEHTIRRDTFAYRLKLMRIDITHLPDFEITLLKALFSNFQLHEEISLDFMKSKLSQQALQLRKSISATLTSQGYFRVNPFMIMNYYVIGVYVGVGLAFLLLGLFHSAGPIWFGTGGGFLIALIFMHFVPSRTAKGTKAREHLLGLRLYLKTAEADRLKMLQSPGAPYVITAQPVRTVELFEKLLPYAMVLGVEKEWAKQFEDLYKTPPDWYDGNWHIFNSVYLVSALNDSMAPSINTAFAAPTSSASSGLGGGFAGGGGGGGGGAGW